MLAAKAGKTRNDQFPPQPFRQGKDDQGFAQGEEEGGQNITRPMGREINARIHDGEGDRAVKQTAPPIKKRGANCDNGIVIGMTRGKGRAGDRAFFGRGEADEGIMKDGQEFWLGPDHFENARRLHLFGTWTTDGCLEGIDNQIGKSQGHQRAQDKGAPTEPAKNAKRDARREEKRPPKIGAADRRHEEVEERIRPLLIDQMKNPFVHGRRRWSENRSRPGLKQAVLAFCLIAALHPCAEAQNFPDAQEVLANVRLRQSAQQIDLKGQLRQDALVVPFHLVQEGPLVRYIFSNPDETLQLKLGANDARLEEISRQGTEKIAGNRLDDRIRGTAITFEDLALKFLYWPNARIVGADFIRTRNCWKMQLVAPAKGSQYGSVILWVDKDSGALMRMEGYDPAGKLIRRFEVVSAQKIEDRWYLKQMRVEAVDPVSARVTARTYLEIVK